MVQKQNSFDIVIATRNRYDALTLSVPLMLSEKRQPKNLIVVDSSDNHEQIKQLILNITAGWSGKVVVFSTSPPSSSRQRNLGLAYVTSDVVIFPDDDSLIVPGAFEQMMRIYDLDEECKITGVCAAEAIFPPEGLLGNNTYKLTWADQIKKNVAKARDLFERNLIPNALLFHGRSLIAKHTIPSWLAYEDAIPVEYMTGFRMSFRASVINKYKFTEVFSGYCLAEDVGASFLALRDGLLVGARKARIYHHRYPGFRANGYIMGLVHIINIAYVLSKSMQTIEVRTVIAFYIQSIYKLLLYATSFRDEYARERIKGAVRGIRVAGKMFNAKNDDELDAAYAAEFMRANRKTSRELSQR